MSAGRELLLASPTIDPYTQPSTSVPSFLTVRLLEVAADDSLVKMAMRGVEVMKEERELSEIRAVQSASQQALWRLLRTPLAFLGPFEQTPSYHFSCAALRFIRRLEMEPPRERNRQSSELYVG
ncbi:hypothetical protein Q8A67_007548 [Cirrhinus molitorella]|uniref:Uncharacterized protein n=1 Tax=Cirrhinus molitorella TaxID=172907 RepID=A0AA88Q7G7_9TELE|nr:hypothetical protein Q8A67_007548 [Cirrhinus molitorella]